MVPDDRKYICDCGAVYSHPDQILHCAHISHGGPQPPTKDAIELSRLRKRYDEVVKALTIRRKENEELREALKCIPIFHSNGITKTCVACGAQHFFSDGPPVEINHQPECWGAAVLLALATLATRSTSK